MTSHDHRPAFLRHFIPYLRIWLSIFTIILSCSQSQSQPNYPPPAPVDPVPTAAQLEWHAMEMNAFIHFTINTFTDREWGFGDESPTLFNPASANPGQWVKTLKSAGFKGIILTAKHHDGFCLWPSAYTEHSVKNAPWKEGKGDVVGELAEACRRHGMKFGIYVSPWDRNHARYGRPEYVDYYRAQMTELIRRYGPFFEIWFDGANGGDGYYGGTREQRKINGRTYYDWPGTISRINRLQESPIFFSDAGPGCRWIGNEQGVAGETNWNTITADTLYAGKPGISELLNTGTPGGTHWIPGECDVSIRPGWFWHAREDTLVKTPEQLFDIYLTSVGRGSVLLLNVPPDRRGLLHETDVKALAGFSALLGKEFKTNRIAGATVRANKVRGDDPGYSPRNLSDQNPETYWAIGDADTSATIAIELPAPQMIKYLVLQEYIRLGQRISAFRAEAYDGRQWTTIARGTTIGYKRILKIEPVVASEIRIYIENARACPVLSEIGLY